MAIHALIHILVFNVQVLIKYPTKPVYCTPLVYNRDIIKSLACKHYQSAAKHVLDHHHLRKLVIAELSQHMRKELGKATGSSSDSLITRHDAHSLQSFSWGNLENDLIQHCGQLHEFLKLCVPKQKRNQARGILSLIIAMLGKLTNQKARFVETVISLILLSGHATSQVSIHQNCQVVVIIYTPASDIVSNYLKHVCGCIYYIVYAISLAGTTEVAPPATDCAPKYYTTDPGRNPGSLLKGNGQQQKRHD